MQTNKIIFEADFIGEQTKLTIEEEIALSNYFKQKKAKSKSIEPKRKNRSDKKVTE